MHLFEDEKYIKEKVGIPTAEWQAANIELYVKTWI